MKSGNTGWPQELEWWRYQAEKEVWRYL